MYPRGLKLLESGQIDLNGLVSHRFDLDQTPQAFALNADYQDQVVKVMIDVNKAC